jgi:hypothetical protein
MGRSSAAAQRSCTRRAAPPQRQQPRVLFIQRQRTVGGITAPSAQAAGSKNVAPAATEARSRT